MSSTRIYESRIRREAVVSVRGMAELETAPRGSVRATIPMIGRCRREAERQGNIPSDTEYKMYYAAHARLNCVRHAVPG